MKERETNGIYDAHCPLFNILAQVPSTFVSFSDGIIITS